MIVDAADYCLICAPDGPSTPFGTPALILYDTMRMICWIFAGFCAAYMPRAIMLAKLPGQRVRFLGQALFAVVAVATEVDHFGDTANYRLVVNAVALGLCAWGLWSFFREQRRIAAE